MFYLYIYIYYIYIYIYVYIQIKRISQKICKAIIHYTKKSNDNNNYNSSLYLINSSRLMVSFSVEKV